MCIHDVFLGIAYAQMDQLLYPNNANQIWFLIYPKNNVFEILLNTITIITPLLTVSDAMNLVPTLYLKKSQTFVIMVRCISAASLW